MKILFLYTELAQYFISCLETLVHTGAEVHLVHWPVNKEAPFQFRFQQQIHNYQRNNYDESNRLFNKVGENADGKS